MKYAFVSNLFQCRTLFFFLQVVIVVRICVNHMFTITCVCAVQNAPSQSLLSLINAILHDKSVEEVPMVRDDFSI